MKAYFLMGMLGDSEETIKESFEFIYNNKISAQGYSFDIVIPYPGTEFFNILKERGWVERITIDNLVWLYKNLYGWDTLKGIRDKKPFWKIGDLSFDDLLYIQKKYYSKVKRKAHRRSLAFTFYRDPAITLRAIQKPRKTLSFLKNYVMGRD